MTTKGSSSPREEALEIASQTRKKILSGGEDVVSILRACLVIANNLHKEEDMNWIRRELSGYSSDVVVPGYRICECPYKPRAGSVQKKAEFTKLMLRYPIHMYVQHVKRNISMTFVEEVGDIYLDPERMENMLCRIGDRCLFFLNDVVNELQYGGVVEYLMEEIRTKTDEGLATLDSKITDETQSLFLNLTSTNPADWSKVGHSCRKVLKLLADKVFPPSDEKYTAKDGKVLEIDDSHFINRLCAFLDQKSSGDELKFLKAEIEYLESYLRQTVNYAQMVEHNPSIAKFHANMLAIHTYLISSEILRHV
jgi:hypothetical protein